ncbi:MAG TPA: methylaspartate ammonia-lyase [Acholeplasmatales bacterium]|nr:MAG: methylaspartate ammonia-lyase [Tenericutes bacterium GWF2_57_13]HAQ56014.1 methylaspartate ammonia-lyase [Acholeplasmatales bacterium]
MKIQKILLTQSYTGFYFDDQKAIKKGATTDGFMYVGEPATPGFTAIRQSGEAISVQIVLEDGIVGYGDCAAIQYSGAGGRDPLFLAKDYIPLMKKHIVPLLVGKEIDKFRPLAEWLDKLEIGGKRLHTAIRYGLSQAILSAVANHRRLTMAEVVRDEYQIRGKKYASVPIFSQSGDDRYTNVDKMIMKEVDVLPHALINNVETKLGKHGEILLAYVVWLRDRILAKRTRPDYQPVFHIDVYGTLGLAFRYDYDKIFAYLLDIEKTASPFRIRIEGPVDTGDRQGTFDALKKLTAMIDKAGSHLEIVADEWCNTIQDVVEFADAKAGHMLQIKTPVLGGVNNSIEAILYCNKKHIGSYCGGTCNETNLSAETTTNIAIACRADQCLAKPGMSVDDGFMIVKNAMNRVIAIANDRAEAKKVQK